MQKKVKLSIQKKFFFLITTITAFTIVILSFIFLSRVEYTFKEELNDKALALANSSAYYSINAILAHDESAINEYLNQLLKTKDLVYVIISDNKGKKLAQVEKSKSFLPTNEVDTKVFLSKEVIKQEFKDKTGQNLFEIAMPIESGGANWGITRIGFSLNDIEDKIFYARSRILLLGFLTLLFGAWSAKKLARAISEPIKKLTNSANEIAVGNFQDDITIKSGDEIEELANSFNFMKEELKNSLNKLNIQANELKYTNTILDKKVIELTSLYNVSKSIGSSLDRSMTLKLVMELSLKISDSSRGLIITVNPSDNKVTTELAYEISKDELLTIENFFKGVNHEIINSHEPFYINIENINNKLLISPLYTGNEFLGAICIIHRNAESLNSEDLKVMSILSSQAATAIYNASLFERTTQLANTDGLTGLYNHRYFQLTLNNLVETYKANQKILSFLLIDVDYFKEFNDTYGHVSGDKVLQEISLILKKIPPDHSIIARYGGEEFAVIIPDADNFNAHIIAENIRRTVEEHIFDFDEKPRFGITVSIGVSTLIEDAQSKTELIEHADIAMYKAKNQGRNRVLCYVNDESLSMSEAAATVDTEITDVDNDDNIYLNVINALASTIDAKDPYVYGHSNQVANYASGIARKMGLDNQKITEIYQAALLHDIGKIGISERILSKPSRLDEKEFYIIKKHPEIGANILRGVSVLRKLAPIVRSHHEKYDGSGYPDNIKGTDIPLAARIICVADSFDAMTSDRPYRKGMSTDVAIRELIDCSGTQFDPEVVQAFLNLLGRDLN